ncbi:SRPBCC family protein [Gordonia sp. ABSL1-1]|uniref:SRPBCC family protein n=1 Tax=Gordonia sp. ABSL1-1 TaxID=3053923 RepID=UPI002572728E|nr:SRPBCC family protein [Gordonia sp. ABSL1-1]MDL9936953.1 SRPBCC family protein [Gordonia sp. ABSL1-1]
MAVSAKTSFDVAAPVSVVMEVLLDVESLPEWSGPHREAEILTEHPDGSPETVRMVVSTGPITDEQTCSYTWTDNSCEWDLVESNSLKHQHGRYVVTETPKGSHVDFELEIDLKIKLPGLIVKQGQRVAVDTAKKGLTAEAQRRAAD